MDTQPSARNVSARALNLGLAAWGMVLAMTNCGGGKSGPAVPTQPPVIASFTASQPHVVKGGTVTLTAVFSDGTGSVTPLVGALTSGVPISSGPIPASTTFMLNVFNGDGYSMASTRVWVGELSLFAGVPSGVGNLDGTGSQARFQNPEGIACDGEGNVYVADTYNHLIRKISPSGVVSTLAGRDGAWGSQDGPGSAALFDGPVGIAVDGAGTVYVADTNNCTIRKITPNGMVSTLAGLSGNQGYVDGEGSSARFSLPSGLALDGVGNVYVADWSYNIIRKITPEGVVVTFAGQPGVQGSANGPGKLATFTNPWGLTVDNAGNVYVADAQLLRMITPDGTVSTLVTTTDGPGGQVSDTGFAGLSMGRDGNLLAVGADVILQISPAGLVTTLAGQEGIDGWVDGPLAQASFHWPLAAAMDPSGNIYVADTGNNTIRKVAGAAVTTLAGSASQPGYQDGLGSSARFNGPSYLTMDASGNAYVSDGGNCSIRKISPGGNVTTLAGTGVQGSTDTGAWPASFSGPAGLAVDGDGNVFVADFGNSTIRRISAEGVVTTYSGRTGLHESLDGVAANAAFRSPNGVALDGVGNLYVSDFYDSLIRKIAPDGTVSTVAGSPGGGLQDGIGAQGRFHMPTDLIMNGDGNLFVADFLGQAIRMVSPTGVVTTVAGTLGVPGSIDGSGDIALFNNPVALALDASGNLYVAEFGNDTIRKITFGGPKPMVSTVAGVAGRAAVGLGDTPGFLLAPNGVAVDPLTGDLLISQPDAILRGAL